MILLRNSFLNARFVNQANIATMIAEYLSAALKVLIVPWVLRHQLFVLKVLSSLQTIRAESTIACLVLVATIVILQDLEIFYLLVPSMFVLLATTVLKETK